MDKIKATRSRAGPGRQTLLQVRATVAVKTAATKKETKSQLRDDLTQSCASRPVRTHSTAARPLKKACWKASYPSLSRGDRLALRHNIHRQGRVTILFEVTVSMYVCYVPVFQQQSDSGRRAADAG